MDGKPGTLGHSFPRLHFGPACRWPFFKQSTGVNVREVRVPKARPIGETYAYTVEEILKMLGVLPDPARVIVAVAAFTGLRRSEIRGLSWIDYDGRTIRVRRSVWEGFVNEPKTKQSKAEVPVITLLARILDTYHAHCGNISQGPIFSSTAGTPLHLTNVVNRQILVPLKKTGLKWHGWHAFRRGLGTNLRLLGVDFKTIQEILRHAHLSTTADLYVKEASEEGKGDGQAGSKTQWRHSELRFLCNPCATGASAFQK